MWTQLRTVRVQPGRNAEFAELQKELGAALKAADRPPRLIYQEIRGDVGVFHVLSRAASLAEFDTPFVPPMSDKAWTNWLARYQDAIDSSTLMLLRRYPDIGVSTDDDTPPNLVVLPYRTAVPGKADEYGEWAKTQLVPHLKMGGVKNVAFSRIQMGGNNNTWIGATWVANWAKMDGEGPLDHMGDKQRQAMLDAGNALLVETENRVIRYRADLNE